jgi:hypothetical protein
MAKSKSRLGMVQMLELVILGYFLAFAARQWTLARLPQIAIHYHADLAVFVNGQKLSFDADKFQSGEKKTLHPFIHFHDGNGSVVHLERTGYDLQDLFRSFGGDLNWRCLVVDSARFCDTPFAGLKLYVNGKRIWNGTQYRPADLDRILISYGPWLADVDKELEAVSNDACIYSDKCPERGSPPEEDCVANMGQPCVLPGQSAN